MFEVPKKEQPILNQRTTEAATHLISLEASVLSSREVRDARAFVTEEIKPLAMDMIRARPRHNVYSA